MEKIPGQNEAQSKWPKVYAALEKTLQGTITIGPTPEDSELGRKMIEDVFEALKKGDTTPAKELFESQISNCIKSRTRRITQPARDAEHAALHKSADEQGVRTIYKNSQLIAELEGISLE